MQELSTSALTTEFMNSAIATVRKPYGKLTIIWSDPTIDPSITVATNDDNRGSQKEQVADLIANPSYQYTILDGTWTLDDTKHLAPSTAAEIANYQIGWYSDTACAADGTFSPAYPYVQVDFDARTIEGVYVAGDRLLNQFPVDFVVQVYNTGGLVLNLSVTDNASVDFYHAQTINSAVTMVLTVTKWSSGSTCLKILEFYTALVTEYTGDDIISMDLLEEREIRDGTLPVGNISYNELSIELQNLKYDPENSLDIGDYALVKSDNTTVGQYIVYRSINAAGYSYFDDYTLQYNEVDGVKYYSFRYYYQIPVTMNTDDRIQFLFVPDGAWSGDPAFYSEVFSVNTSVLDPYNPANPSSIFTNLVKPNRIVKAELGFELSDGTVEYMPIGTFWTNDWQLSEDESSVTTSCRDRLGLLRDKIYDGGELWTDESLYNIADDILTYAKTYIPMPGLQWEIDDELLNITVPYGYFDKESYFDILAKISKACMGQCYMGKDDVLRLDSYHSNLYIGVDYDYEITKNNFYQLIQKSEYFEIVNIINTKTFPIEFPLTDSEVYRSNEDIPISATTTLDPIEIKFSTNPTTYSNAYLDEETGGVTVSIVAEEWFTWGGRVTVQNTAMTSGTFKIVVDGYESTQTGIETITAQDDDSIVREGPREFDLKDNHLIQSRVQAENINNHLLDTYKEPRKDIQLQWRGNPALELGDIIHIPIYQRGSIDNHQSYIIYKNELKFDGTLEGIIYGRKTLETELATDSAQDSDDYTGSIPDYQDSDEIYSMPIWQDTDGG